MTYLVIACAAIVGVVIAGSILSLVSRHRRIAIGAIAAINIALVLLFAVAWHLGHPKVYDPLDLSRVQVVNNRLPGITGPAAHINDSVSITGTKCNTSTKLVVVEGRVIWTSTRPPGSILPQPLGLSPPRPPGCQTHTYQNSIPADVKTRTRELFAKGFKQVVWTIGGSETPIDANGKRGIERYWFAESVTIVP